MDIQQGLIICHNRSDGYGYGYGYSYGSSYACVELLKNLLQLLLRLWALSIRLAIDSYGYGSGDDAS